MNSTIEDKANKPIAPSVITHFKVGEFPVVNGEVADVLAHLLNPTINESS